MTWSPPLKTLLAFSKPPISRISLALIKIFIHPSIHNHLYLVT